jgi:hypothetical protein
LAFWINVLWQKGFFTDNCDVWVNQAAIRVEDQLFPLLIPLPPSVDEQVSYAAALARRLKEVEAMHQAAVRQTAALAALPGAILREAYDFIED